MHDFYPMYVTRIENLQNYLTTFRTKTQGRRGSQTRGGQRHLQLGRMLDIDLISEPPPKPPPPRSRYPKCGNLCGQRGRKRFIASWGLRMSHICPCTPYNSNQIKSNQIFIFLFIVVWTANIYIWRIFDQVNTNKHSIWPIGRSGKG